LLRIDTIAKYKMHLKLGFLDMKGNGTAYGKIENTKLKMRATGSKYMKNGEEYLRIDEVRADLNPGKVTLNFEKLVKGDKLLNDIVNTVINRNVHLFINDIKPPIENSVSAKIHTIMNKVFSGAPIKMFFP